MFHRIVLLGSIATLAFASKAEADYRRSDNVVDFALIYPVVSVKSPAVKRQQTTAGVSFVYSFFLNSNLGLSFIPSVWFFPLRITNNSNVAKEMLYCLSTELGPTFRLGSPSYLNPTFTLSSGVTTMDAGKSAKQTFSYPLSAKASIDLWKSEDPYFDPTLALTLLGGYSYLLQANPLIDNSIGYFGLSFRGSF
ncbi:MAG: hypothetical protein COV44_07045 [Deltaproteobacteria bacterium CG11_big_fil_rev_8_21_14_0_20_45_16]|nr:MAG: hypothetical protein COV44_07045 [Deltaproteobacteria bacterium CG11_big_fil_rev_8_21_14_0_20_45_16]